MQFQHLRSMSGKTMIVVIAVVVAIFVLISFLLWAFGLHDSFVTKTIDFVVIRIVAASGWSYYLVKGLVIILTIPFFWAVAKYTKVAFWHKQLKPSLNLYTNRYGVIIVVYVGLFFVSMYFASLDAFASKYCADTPEGIKVYDSPIEDPVYGVQCKPCSREQIMALRGLSGPQRIEIADPRAYVFFDPLTGRPLVWYYRLSNNEYELYNSAGIHPRTGDSLLTVTKDIVDSVIQRYIERQREISDSTDKARRDSLQAAWLRELSQYVNLELRNRNGIIDVTVCIIDEAKSVPDTEMERLIGAVIQSKGQSVVTGFIRPRFIDEKLPSLFAGDISAIRNLALQTFVDEMIIGRRSVSFAESLELGNLKTAIMRVEWKKINLRDGSFKTLPSVEVRGAGFDEAAAANNALKLVGAKLESALQAI